MTVVKLALDTVPFTKARRWVENTVVMPLSLWLPLMVRKTKMAQA